jgi:multicomponent Na+:H+ antiporter subunit B
VSEALLASLLLLLVVLAVLAVVAADLLIAALTLGAYSFVLAMIWAAIGAVDVAFTEAVVGAGASTIFYLAALLRTSRRRSPLPSRTRWVGLVVALGTGAAILAVSNALPIWGDPSTPPAEHVSPYYLEHALTQTATPNVVTAVLADYRGYDTLIETLVIFTAGLGCWLLLRQGEQ